MYRLWAKVIKNNKIINSIDVSNDDDISIEKKKSKCFSKIFNSLDISSPVWLSNHYNNFSEFKMVTFYKHDFIDTVDFDKLEIELLDDGMPK